MIGLPITGTIGLGRSHVRASAGHSFPPAMMTAFMLDQLRIAQRPIAGLELLSHSPIDPVGRLATLSHEY